MRKILGVVVVLSCLVWGSEARAYELIRVLSGDVLLVEQDGQQLRLELSGIWVPAPPGPGVRGDYRGEEARRSVEEVLLKFPAYIREAEPIRPGQTSIQVRIRLGEHGEHDLAVLLAKSGLGLMNRTADADPEHLEAVYQAERDARRHQRGMHDGGYQRFAHGVEGVVVDMGIGTLAAQRGVRRRGSLREYLDDDQGSRQSSSRTSGDNGIHRSGVEAIRDWGSRMGLPHDNSALGR